MPLTKSGMKVMGSMEKEYGHKKGKQVFYASINKNKKGSNKWEEHSPSKMKRREMGMKSYGQCCDMDTE